MVSSSHSWDASHLLCFPSSPPITFFSEWRLRYRYTEQPGQCFKVFHLPNIHNLCVWCYPSCSSQGFWIGSRHDLSAFGTLHLSSIKVIPHKNIMRTNLVLLECNCMVAHQNLDLWTLFQTMWWKLSLAFWVYPCTNLASSSQLLNQ